MENLQQKAEFLKNEYAPMLVQLDENAARKWGKMNVRQMTEHMSDYIRIASGKTHIEVLTPEDQWPRMQAFSRQQQALQGEHAQPADAR